GRFARVEPRRRVRALVLGCLSDLPRKNCWSIAGWAGGRVRTASTWSRRRVEETFQAGKSLAGLGTSTGSGASPRRPAGSPWPLLAHAFLAVVRADEHTRYPKQDRRAPPWAPTT